MQNNSKRKTILIICGFILAIFGFFCYSHAAMAMGSPIPLNQFNSFLIDGFEDGNITDLPEWWVFDNGSPEAVNSVSFYAGDPISLREMGEMSLEISGKRKSGKYVGGIGNYFAKSGKDLSSYQSFQMDIYGHGEGKGVIRIELFDDDNGNWKIEQGSKEGFSPHYDDRFVYEVEIDWEGWRRVIIPLKDFRDDNFGVGDGIWNPAQVNGSGGLLQMQLIFMSNRKIGDIGFALDNIKLVK